MSEPILEAFCQLAEDEIKRTPTLTSEMNLLLQGLKDAQPEETGEHYTHPVVEKHFKKILGEGSGVLADIVSLTADRLSWGVPYAEHVGEPDMDELRERAMRSLPSSVHIKATAANRFHSRCTHRTKFIPELFFKDRT